MSLLTQIAAEQERVSALIRRNRDKWAEDLQQRLTDAGARYQVAVQQLDQARADLVEEARLGAWLAVFPDTNAKVPGLHLLPGDPETPRVGGPPTSSELFDATRSSCPHAARAAHGGWPARPRAPADRRRARRHRRCRPPASVRGRHYRRLASAGPGPA